MNRFFLFFFFIISSCTQGLNSAGLAITVPAPVPLTHKEKFFGYYASQMEGVGVTGDIDDLKDKSNFVFIASDDLKNKLDKCREVGIKAMVSFSWYYFNDQLRLYPNWQERLAPVLEIIDQYQDVIIANYILDEPFMNATDKQVSLDDMYSYLETIGIFFKTRYPKIPLAVIFSATEIRNGYRLPPSFDWFGMDCYDSYTWCGKKSIPGYYQLLKTEIKKLEDSDHKEHFLMAVPPSGYEANNPKKQEEHFQQINLYRNFIKSEPKIKIVIPFLWQTFNPSSGGWIGARDSAKLKEPYIKFYIDFMNDAL